MTETYRAWALPVNQDDTSWPRCPITNLPVPRAIGSYEWDGPNTARVTAECLARSEPTSTQVEIHMAGRPPFNLVVRGKKL